MGHTTDALYLAYIVTDNFLDLNASALAPQTDDGVELYINADIQDNGRNWSRGGFQLFATPAAGRSEDDYLQDGRVRVDAVLDTAFNKRNTGGAIEPGSSEETLRDNQFWTEGLPVPGTSSYVLEWKIPLSAMDTDSADGDPVPPKTGDVMLFNTVVNDNDTQGAGGQNTHAMMWMVEDDPRSPWSGAEKTWPIPIELTEKVDLGNPADLNGDGECNAADIDAIAMAIRNGVIDDKYDIDLNGSINRADHLAYIKQVKKTWVGDSNMDGEFSTRDLVTVFEKGAYETGVEADWSSGDWNGDGFFGTTDLVNAFQDGGFELGPIPEDPPEAAMVPEPKNGLVWFIIPFPILLMRRLREGRQHLR
jgi:hypothetical protein